METNRSEYKARAKRLRTAIQSTLGIDCTVSQAHELVAKEENFPNWDALSGVAKEVSPSVRQPAIQHSGVGELRFNSVRGLCLVITGKTGSGKSKLLNSCKHVLGGRLVCVDPLNTAPLRWTEPISAKITAVVLDHVYSFETNSEVLGAAINWCNEHEKLLILSEINLEDFSRKNISLPNDFIHVDMSEIKNSDTPHNMLFNALVNLFGINDTKTIVNDLHGMELSQDN